MEVGVTLGVGVGVTVRCPQLSGGEVICDIAI